MRNLYLRVKIARQILGHDSLGEQNEGVKASLLIESLTGNTWRAAEMVAGNLQQEGWSITGLSPMRTPDHASIQDADVVLVGTWVHGAFIIGQAPWNIGAIRALPALRGKKAVTFCTYALNPGRTLGAMESAVAGLGADVIGGMALHRAKLGAHTEEFAARLVGVVTSV